MEGSCDKLVIGIAKDPASLNSLCTASTSETNLGLLLQPPNWDGTFQCEVKPEPGVFLSWERGADGQTLTVKIDRRNRWEDGKPVTVADYTYTYGLAIDPKSAACRHPRYLDGVSAPDEDTLVFHFNKALPGEQMLTDVLTTPIPAGTPYTKELVVSYGPYKLQSLTQGRVDLVANPAYPIDERKPHVREIEALTYADDASRLLALKSGQIDLMEGVTPAFADDLAEHNPEIQLRHRGWRGIEFITWNGRDRAAYTAAKAAAPKDQPFNPVEVAPHPLFGDARVRRALTQAIDIDTIIKEELTSKVTGDVYARPSAGVVNPALCGAFDASIQRIQLDVAGAAAALAALGWTDHNGDGVIDKDGIEFRFPLQYGAGDQRQEKVGVRIKEQLAAIHVEAVLEGVEKNTLKQLLMDRNYDAAIWTLNSFLFPDQSVYFAPAATWNAAGWVDPAALAEVDAALAAPVGSEEALGHWKRWQQIFYEDQPITPLYWLDDLVAIHTRFENTRVDLVYPWADLHKWTVAADKVKYPGACVGG